MCNDDILIVHISLVANAHPFGIHTMKTDFEHRGCPSLISIHQMLFTLQLNNGLA